MATSNFTKLENLAKELENVKLELAQIKDRSTSSSSKINLKSDELAKWFDVKFHAHLEAPKARKVINDLADTKLHAHKVGL